MKLAASNIGLPPFDHAALLPELAGLGLEGLEVAPSRVWRDTGDGLGPAQVEAYRRSVERAGLRVVGLHSLFFDRPELGLFKPEQRERTLDFLVHLSGVCRDLGGRTLIYGGGRRRDSLPLADARSECLAFLAELLPRIERHGTVLCFEPLGPKDTDFLNTAAECLAFAETVRHPAFGLQLDAKALADNGESGPAPFAEAAASGRLAHFHANDPGLVVVGSTGTVDHAALGRHLRAVAYDGWVSIEQRMLSETDPLADLSRSAETLRRCYS
ncbi:MAG: sugar phosphate isomerase/epimerase [Alphaproteobacteria bacterium]|nr:sugar phosphate isomerase/epimerase [Alphaproteobacteria bacterium]